MMEESNRNPESNSDVPAADSSLSRKQFLQRVVKGAALTGGVLGAPKIIDKFIVPAAYASSSTVCVIGENTSGGIDSIIQTGSGTDIVCIPTAFFTACTNNADADPSFVCP